MKFLGQSGIVPTKGNDPTLDASTKEAEKVRLVLSSPFSLKAHIPDHQANENYPGQCDRLVMNQIVIIV